MNETNQEILSLDDIYFKDAFTKTEDKLNLEVDNANIKCITSRDNKFSLDSEGNLIVKSITAETVNIQNIFDAIYPIGSVYMTFGNTPPSTLFGGVWEQIKDTFLLCAGDTYAVSSTGGEAEHKLTVAEIPSHSHGVNNFSGAAGNDWTYHPTINNKRINRNSLNWTGNSDNVGGGQSHNNMPPYLAVYVWKRTS